VMSVSVMSPSSFPAEEPVHAGVEIRRKNSLSHGMSLAYVQQKREEQQLSIEARQRPYRLSAEIAIEKQVLRVSQKVPMSLLPSIAKPVDFVWPYAGEHVNISGSFGGWKEEIPLQRVNGVWKVSLSLPPGHYQFKFVVDGTWCYDSKQIVCKDSAGNTNNMVIVAA